MKIEKIAIKEIKPNKNNAKLHPQWQLDQIKESIVQFGNNDPIAIDENNVVIEGHGRLMALEQLGYEEAEIIRLEHLTEEQKSAYILAHNKLTMNTDFDLTKSANNLAFNSEASKLLVFAATATSKLASPETLTFSVFTSLI